MLEILSNPIRRAILEIASFNGSVTYSDLSKNLRLKAGSVYHHINALGDLLEQKSDKSYALTSKGKHAIEYLQFLGDHSSIKELDSQETSLFFTELSPLIRYFTIHPRRSMVEIGFLFVIAVTLGSEISVGVFGSFLIPLSESNLLSSVFLAILGWLFIFVVSEVFLLFFYNIKVENHFRLFSGISMFLLGPTILLIGLYLLIVHLQIKTIDLTIGILVEGLLQVWMILAISTSIEENTKATFSQSLVVALLLNYVLLVSMFLFIL